jgi:thioredoxin-related protein
MKKVTKFIICMVLLSTAFSFIRPKKEKINWLSVAELKLAYNNAPKPILVDVYTDWCGWCKVMDRETYEKESVVNYINEHYYAVKLNAESKDSLEWGDKKYGYNQENKSNELAVYLLYGQMSFPTTVFLPAINAQPAPLAGFLKPKELESPLKFFGDGEYKTKTFQEFMKTFNNTWK